MIKKAWLYFFLLLLVWYACTDQSLRNSVHGNILSEIEKLPHPDSTNNSRLDSLRPFISVTDTPALKRYYRLKYLYHASYYSSHLNESGLYADSLINLFTVIQPASSDKKAYFDALTYKGDVLFQQMKFNQAAVFFLEARSLSQKYLDSCSSNRLAKLLGHIYNQQGRYQEAARNYKQAYYGTLNCAPYADKNDEVYQTQSRINTIGFAYENAGMLDSALHYYVLNYHAIQREKKNIRTTLFNDIRVVNFDNLGSIYLKKENYPQAEAFLVKSLNTPYSQKEDVRIPILLKLADLYLIRNEPDAAKPMLDRTEKLLETFPSDLSVKLYALQTRYYFIKGDYQQAYLHQQKFIERNNQLIDKRDQARSIDVEKDFLNMQQRANILDLQRKDERKSSYLILVIILCVLVGIIAALIDRNRRQSRNNHRLLVRQNATLEQTLQKLELANTNYSNVLKVMAHDLKNPLTGIARIADIVVESKKQAESTREMFGIIKESADSAVHTINDLLNSALMNQGIEVLNKQNTDLSQLLQQCVALLKFRAEEKKQAITLSGEQHIHAFLDREKMLRVLNNIIVNAIKFSPENSNILITLHQREGIMISIADNGIGIPTEHAERIFHPFTSARREGTAGEKPYGLGLSICKQIVEAHNGKLWFENNSLGGTIFYIQLPSEVS